MALLQLLNGCWLTGRWQSEGGSHVGLRSSACSHILLNSCFNDVLEYTEGMLIRFANDLRQRWIANILDDRIKIWKHFDKLSLTGCNLIEIKVKDYLKKQQEQQIPPCWVTASRRVSGRIIGDRVATQASGAIDFFGEEKEGGEGHCHPIGIGIGDGQTPSKVLCAILDSVFSEGNRQIGM